MFWQMVDFYGVSGRELMYIKYSDDYGTIDLDSVWNDRQKQQEIRNRFCLINNTPKGEINDTTIPRKAYIDRPTCQILLREAIREKRKFEKTSRNQDK